MRRILAGILALLLLAAAPARAQSDAADPPRLKTELDGLRKSIAGNPRNADQIVAIAVAQATDDSEAITAFVRAAIEVEPRAAPRIAAAAASAAPANAATIAATAAATAATAAGRAASRRGTQLAATQAALTASATAAADTTQAVILAMGSASETGVTAEVASAITREAVAAAMPAVAKAATEAAQAAGASPQEAAILGDQAARLAATTVTRSAIAAATSAVRQAATTDALTASRRAGASPESVAKSSAAAASTVADSVTRGAVAGSLSVTKVAPVGMASSVADAAAAATSTAVSSAANQAATDAGAAPEDAEKIASAAGADAAKSVGDAAAAAAVDAVPDLNLDDAAAASGPALAGGIAGLKKARGATGAVNGTTGLKAPPNRVAAVQAEAQALNTPPPARAPSSGSSTASYVEHGDSLLENPQRLIPLIFSVLAFLTVIGLALPWLEPDIFKSRLKVITDRRGELSEQRKQRLTNPRPSLRLAIASGRVNFMRSVIQKLKLNTIMEQPELRKKLIRAGKRTPQAAVTYTFLRFALPLFATGFTALLLFGSKNVHIVAAFKVVICMGAFLFGFMLPDILISNAITRRQGEIQRKFPDALDLMVICIESGISLEAAFGRVADEMGNDAPALAEEIAITTAELSFLSDRRQALENLSERTGLQPVKSLVTSLIQSEKYGTPLGVALRVVSQESRESRMALAEEKAASLPAKLTVPMVTFFLPVLFLVLIGPTIIQVMKAFSH